MERFTKWAFRNKAAVLFTVVLVLVMGVVSYLTLPKELLPEVDIHQITVTVMGQGYDAATMDDQVTSPIEDAVAGVKGKTEVLSTTGDGYSQVSISFDSNTNMKDAKSDVTDAVNNVILPTGMTKPMISQFNLSMIPVADVALTFQNGATQANVNTVKDKIVPLFQNLSGVASASVYGDNPTQVVVKVNPTAMAQHHVPLSAIMSVLQGQNMATAVSNETINGEASSIKVVGTIDSIAKLGDLSVLPGVPLKDVATFTVGKTAQTITHLNGKEAVVLIVDKEDSANAVAVGNAVKSEATTVNQQFGPQISASVPYATSDTVLNSVNSMMREVLLGALFATVVILLFLRSIRMTLITVVSIPLSLGMTLFLLSESGITLNILTLGAVAVAVGRLVDDSIVVIENIYRKSQLQGVSKDLVIEATKEVGTAITSSTLTTIAVFLPVGLVQGTLQSFMLPFALTVVYSLLSSLVVALTVVPPMGLGMIKKAKLREHKRPERYVRVLTWALNHKWVPLTAALVVFVASMVTYQVMPKGELDTSDASFVSVNLNYPSTVPFSSVVQGAEKLEKYIVAQPQAQNTLLMIGNSSDSAKYGAVGSPNNVSFSVIMKDGANTNQFVQNVNNQKSSYPDADLAAFAQAGWGSSNTITMDLLGDNVKDLLTASNTLINTVQNIDGVQQVTTNEQDVHPTYTIAVNPNLANAQQIAQQLRAVMNQVPLGTIDLNNKSTNVVLDSMVNPTSMTDLNNMQIGTNSGIVPLHSIATITKSNVPSTVLRKDGNEFVRVSVQIDPKKLSVVATQIALKTKNLTLPTGVTLDTGGASSQQSSDFSDLGKTMAVAIGVVYLILILTFKNLRTPIAILVTLLLASIGAVLGLVVTGTPVDPSSLIGMLILIGIVVTNAIVLLDRVKQNEAKNIIIRESIIEGATSRVRPILMTAIATICAMMPLLFSKGETGSIVSKSLAVVVIGGLAVATVLTLVIVPVFYELLYYRRSRAQRKNAGEVVSAQAVNVR